MYRAHVIAFMVAGLLALGGWALAHQAPPDAEASAAKGEPFVVSPTGDSAVLLETHSGKTWVLHRSVVEGDPVVWLPANRIDSDREVDQWRNIEKAQKQARVKR